MVALTVVMASMLSVLALGFAENLQGTTGKPLPQGENLVSNADFEDGDQHWQLWGESDVIADGGRSQTSGLQLGTDSYAEQSVDSFLEADSEYRFCGWSRLDRQSGNQEAWVGLQYYDESDNIVDKVQWEVTWQSYREQCRYFTTLSEYDDVVVWVWTSDRTGDVSVAVDDISLVRTRYITDGT